MSIQWCWVELGKDINLSDVTVDAITDWDIDETIVGTKWHSWLCSLLGERIESRPSTSSKNDTKDTLETQERKRNTRVDKYSDDQMWLLFILEWEDCSKSAVGYPLIGVASFLYPSLLQEIRKLSQKQYPKPLIDKKNYIGSFICSKIVSTFYYAR